jgi:hypothetical protein
MRYPEGRILWATVRVSGRQVAYHIGDWEKVSLESFGIRIRDPTNSEIPIRGDGRWKSQRARVHRRIGTSGFRVRSSEIPFIDIAK